MAHALIIGYGISGRSAAHFLREKGYSIVALDRRHLEIEKEADIILKSDQEFIDLAPFEWIVVSPGISLHHPIYQAASKLNKQVVGEIELACRYLNFSVIGVTGTNGKTSVTLMVAHVLNACKVPAMAVGNVGVPLTSKIKELEGKVAVLELSSFQLETFSKEILDTAVLLNITPDHLDRYDNLESYAKSKIKIGTLLKRGSLFFVEERTYNHFYSLFKNFNPKLYGYSEICTIRSELKNIIMNNSSFPLPSHLQGHKSIDLENVLAAYAVCTSRGVEAASFFKALDSFKKPQHRMQFVREINGVCYYDDSKGTNLDAVIRAVEILPGKIILIAGGVDKGSAYTPWIKEFAGKVKCIFALGEAKQKIKQDLEPAIPVFLCQDLQTALKSASQMALLNEQVLLSPGCSSYDMFRDYKHRGEEFQRLVKSL